MKFARSLLFVTALALPAFSEYLRITPPAPGSSDNIVAELGGVWGNGCVPRNPSVVRGGATITVTVRSLEGEFVCTQAPRSWKEEVALGALPPGVYTLRLEVVHLGLREIKASLTFPVSDADAAYTLTPNAGPAAGGTDVFVSGSFGSCPIVPPCHQPQVLFGGMPAASVTEVSGGVIARTPPHAPGTVDVELRGLAGTSLAILPAAFTFQGPGLPNPASFTPVLIPLIVQGPGAFGSLWGTRASGYNHGDVAVTPLNGVITNCPPNVSPCPPPPFRPKVWESFHYGAAYPSGVLVWLPRSQAGDVHFSIKVQDFSRSVDTDGTNIPVVREEELLPGDVHLLDIPLREGFRYTLRVYDVGFTEGRQVTVNAFGPDRQYLTTKGLTLTAADEGCLGGPVGCIPNLPRFASASDFVPTGQPGVDRMRLEITPNHPGMRLWAFVSVTNNITQQITTITPE